MSGVLDDYDGRRISNDAFVNGARAAGISGSGPAVVILSPSITPQTITRMKRILKGKGKESNIIEAKSLNSQGEDVDSD